MKTGTIILIVIFALVAAALVALYFISKKAQKKQEETQQQMKASAQTLSMLIIDKKKMKIKEAGLPAVSGPGRRGLVRGGPGVHELPTAAELHAALAREPAHLGAGSLSGD